MCARFIDQSWTEASLVLQCDYMIPSPLVQQTHGTLMSPLLIHISLQLMDSCLVAGTGITVHILLTQ